MQIINQSTTGKLRAAANWASRGPRLAQKKDVRIYGFGVFSAQERAERPAFNPKTREKIVVPAQWVPKFRAMSALKSAINGQKIISE